MFIPSYIYVSYREGCVYYIDSPPCKSAHCICMAYLTGRAVCVCVRVCAEG